LGILSPLSGKIKAVNSALLEKPGTLEDDPYGEGWLCEIQPESWVEETKSYYLGDAAVKWTKKEMARFKDFIALSLQKYSPETETVLQEGGELADHPMAEMPGEIWQDFQASFLNRQD
jgi:glycine cleavage system H protein